MAEEELGKNGMRKADLQYAVCFHSKEEFELGCRVFMKAHPSYPMIVTKRPPHHLHPCPCSEEDKESHVWLVCTTTGQRLHVAPEIILPYEYRSLMIFKEEHHVCFN